MSIKALVIQKKERKEYEKKVLKKLPYHPDVHEINLGEDQEEAEDQNEEEENPSGNNSWFFQKVVDDDAM